MRALLAISFLFALANPAALAQEAISPSPGVTPPAAAHQDVLLYALSLSGTQYKFGGKSGETGFDCSGFVSHVFQQMAGIALPRTAHGISRMGNPVDVRELKPGDLVFFNTLRRAFSHVGIYLGDNRFIHASSSRTGDVMISDMTDRYWSTRFDGARRLAALENP